MSDLNPPNNGFQFSDHALSLLENYYMNQSEKPTEALRRAAYAYANNPALAERVYQYALNGWFMFSSPILSNAGRTGMPISCFLTYVDDTIEGLLSHTNELRMMSVIGGGVGGHWSDVRAVSKKAPGPIPFLKTVDADVVAYRQGSVRRGSYAAYIDISHPDILEFASIRLPTGGDPNRKCFNLHNAINISDEFMQAVVNGAQWNLIDPHSKEVRDTVDARELWQRLLEIRFRTGEPYLCFIDTANRALPQSLKDKGLRINGSNLCSEIFLPTAADRSAVCCLSSVNVERFDDWCDTNMVSDLIEFLDDVLQYFIDHAPKSLARAIYSASRERSLGLGAMGFHAYLQSRMIPFEGLYATIQNHRIFSTIKRQAEEASRRLALTRGEYPDGIGTGLRNAHLLAIAPNSNSAVLMDTSPSIEPWKSNSYTHRTRAGAFRTDNPYLVRLLKTKEGVSVEEVMDSVVLNGGSVQHLSCLTDDEKAVFKTAFEIDQMWLVEHASERQEYICQGQSLNLFFPFGTDKNYVNAVHLSAWRKGLKSVYYLRTEANKTAEKVSEKVERKPLKDYAIEECLSCQG